MYWNSSRTQYFESNRHRFILQFNRLVTHTPQNTHFWVILISTFYIAKRLLLYYRTELGKSINTDEAAAMGAVYQAAYLGKGFKVKTFGVKEASIYPITVRLKKKIPLLFFSQNLIQNIAIFSVYWYLLLFKYIWLGLALLQYYICLLYLSYKIPLGMNAVIRFPK